MAHEDFSILELCIQCDCNVKCSSTITHVDKQTICSGLISNSNREAAIVDCHLWFAYQKQLCFPGNNFILHLYTDDQIL